MKMKAATQILFALTVLLQSCEKVLASPAASNGLNVGNGFSNIEATATPMAVAANCGLYALYFAGAGLCEIVCFSVGAIMALRALKKTSRAVRLYKLAQAGGLWAFAFVVPYIGDSLKF